MAVRAGVLHYRRVVSWLTGPWNAVAGWWSGLSLTEQVAVGSVLLAAASLLVAISAMRAAHKNARTADEALKLAQAQDERRNADLKVRIERAGVTAADGWRDYEVDVMVTNPTDSSNSVQRAELVLDYLIEGEVRRVRRGMWRVGSDGPTPPAGSAIIPVTIEARGSTECKLHFLLQDDVVPGWDVRRYQIVVSDVYDNEVSDETLLIDNARERSL